MIPHRSQQSDFNIAMQWPIIPGQKLLKRFFCSQFTKQPNDFPGNRHLSRRDPFEKGNRTRLRRLQNRLSQSIDGNSAAIIIQCLPAIRRIDSLRDRFLRSESRKDSKQNI